MCLIFVFASLLEFAVVNVISRKEVRTIKPVRRPPPIRKDMDPENQMDQVAGLRNLEISLGIRWYKLFCICTIMCVCMTLSPILLVFSDVIYKYLYM